MSEQMPVGGESKFERKLREIPLEFQALMNAGEEYKLHIEVYDLWEKGYDFRTAYNALIATVRQETGLDTVVIEKWLEDTHYIPPLNYDDDKVDETKPKW